MDEAKIKNLLLSGIVGINPNERVRVEYPGALRFAESVGVEFERTRADF